MTFPWVMPCATSCPSSSVTVTLGLAAGMLLVAEGLSWWWAPLWSLVIYSGTMQMLLVPLAGAGEPLAAIAASTAFVSGRHVFYGLGFPLDRVRGSLLTRLYAVHAITTRSTHCSPPRTGER